MFFFKLYFKNDLRRLYRTTRYYRNAEVKVDLQCSYSYKIIRVQTQFAFEIARESVKTSFN